MENLPLHIPVTFVLTTLFAVWLFYKANGNSTTTLLILVTWLVLQGLIAVSGFYTVVNTVPPRFVLLVLPPLLTIIALFASPQGRKYIDGLDIKTLTLLHVVRVPVEVVLYWLFVHKVVPKVMTFEGNNFDIFSGLSAPLMFYFGFIKEKLGKNILLIWNFICLALLVNIVSTAVLSAPFPFQKMGFEQPNIAVLYFPFVWLPCCVVPLVLLAHLATIRRLLLAKRLI